jgi:lysophospholipase L1-like esterase
VHLNVGLHDLYLSSKTDRPRHSPDVYAANLRKIFSRLRELTDAKIVFALTTPVDEQRQAASVTFGRVVRRNTDIVRYNRIAVAIAREYDIAINDIHSTAVKSGLQHVLRDDGIHLTGKGADAAGKQVARAVLSALRKKTPTAKPASSTETPAVVSPESDHAEHPEPF